MLTAGANPTANWTVTGFLSGSQLPSWLTPTADVRPRERRGPSWRARVCGAERTPHAAVTGSHSYRTQIRAERTNPAAVGLYRSAGLGGSAAPPVAGAGGEGGCGLRPAVQSEHDGRSPHGKPGPPGRAPQVGTRLEPPAPQIPLNCRSALRGYDCPGAAAPPRERP